MPYSFVHSTPKKCNDMKAHTVMRKQRKGEIRIRLELPSTTHVWPSHVTACYITLTLTSPTCGDDAVKLVRVRRGVWYLSQLFMFFVTRCLIAHEAFAEVTNNVTVSIFVADGKCTAEGVACIADDGCPSHWRCLSVVTISNTMSPSQVRQSHSLNKWS